MGTIKKKAYLLYLPLIIFNTCTGSPSDNKGKDPTTSFNRNYTGVYFDPVDFMRYNGLTHTLDETGLASLVQKIHSTFDQVMVPFHIPPILGQHSGNISILETVGRENMRLNRSTGNKSRGFIKLIILCKVHNWRDITIIQEQVQRLRDVVFRANSRFPGTIKSVLLEMRDGTNEAYQNYAVFRQFFLKQSSDVKQSPDCTFGLQMSIETSATVLIKAWKWNENLQDIPGTTYFSEYFNGDIDGDSATTYLDTLKTHFGTYRKAIGNLNNGTEICFMATWPDTGVGRRVKYSELMGLWNEMNDWALESRNLVIFLQAFDTPLAPEERMMTNGWWRLLPNSSYRHPSQFIFEDKTSLTDIDSEKESILSNMAWLRREAQFSRDSTAVVFNPDILRYPIDKPNPYSNATLKALVQQVSTQFSKILISTTRLTVDDAQGILFVPQIVAQLGLNGSTFGDEAMEVIMTFDESSVNSVTHAAQTANKLAKHMKGVVKQLIYIPSTFQKAELISATQKITNAAGGFKDVDLGIQINLSVCSDRGDFINFMKLARSNLNSVPSKGKFIHISANIPYQHTKLGADRLVPIYTAMLGNCKSKVEEYFHHANESINVTFSTKWPPYDEEGLIGVTEFLKFCGQMNEFSLSSNSTVVFSSAFDEPDGATLGWWKLLENETFPENVDDFLFEDKKQAALRYAEEELSRDHISTTPLNILSISAVAFPILLIAVILSTICYQQRINKSKYLTSAEIGEFFNGGGDHSANGVKEPYKQAHFELLRSSFTIQESSLLGSGAFGKVCLGTISKEGKENKEVAVKMTKVPCPRTALRALLFEIKILAYLGTHAHIVVLVGAYTAELKKSRAFVFLELCALGSLESYLRKQRPDVEASHSNDYPDSITDYMSPDNVTKLDEILSEDMYRWAGEIANGMEFIASKHIVHLDIASRNILLTADKRAKITDFGLSRRLYDYQTYVKKEQEPLPWRWMAPESLRKSEFTEKSDVWGFGVLLWEIYSLGDEPYPGLSFDFNFAAKLERGLRLDQPIYNENEIYSVMLRCWSTNPERRPTFSELTQCFRLVPPPECSDSGDDELDLSSVPIHQMPGTDPAVSNQSRQTDSLPSGVITSRVKVGGQSAMHFWAALSIMLIMTLVGILIMSLFNYITDGNLTHIPIPFPNSNAELNESYNNGNLAKPTTDWTLTANISIAPEGEGSEVAIGNPMTSLPDSRGNRKDAALGQKLFSLIEQHDVKYIAVILQFNADPNQRNGKLETPIIRAAHVPDTNLSLIIIRLLIDHGADVYARDEEDRTFLHVLVSRGSLTPPQFHDIAAHLISKNRSTSSLFVMEGWTKGYIVFHITILKFEVEKRTLALLHEEGVDFNILDNMGDNVLAYAILGRRSHELMLDLMKFGADRKHLNQHGWNLLHIAAQGGLVDDMSFLLKLGLEVNAQDDSGFTPLHRAVLFATGNISEVVQLLVDNGAKVQLKGYNGRSPLQSANMRHTMMDKEKVVNLLSGRELAEEKPDILGTRLFDLIDKENEDLVKVLVEYGADINIRNDQMETPLLRSTHCFVDEHSVCLRIAKYLIENGADVYARDIKNKTFLHNIVTRRTTPSPFLFHEVASFLISMNLSETFNTPGYSFGATPLHFAVRYIDGIENRTLALLKSNGVNFNSLSSVGSSILTYSVLGGRSVSFLSKLVALGANWKYLDKKNRSMIHVSAYSGHIDGVKYFLNLGLDVNAADVYGDTPLHQAVLFGENNLLEITKLLIGHGANILLRDDNGRTPLEDAVRRKNFTDKNAVIQWLKDSEIAQEDPGTLSKRLFEAIGKGNEDLVKSLVEYGVDVDVNMRNFQNKTPLLTSTYCSKDNLTVCLGIAKYLIEKGADVYAKDHTNRTFLHNLVAWGTKLSPSQFHDISLYLISKNCSELFNTFGSSSEVTPVHLAVRYIDEVEYRTLALLKSNGVNFNSFNSFGSSILTYSVLGGRSVNFLSKLVALGANWQHMDKKNRSMIHVSAHSGHIDGVKYFVSLGLNVNAVDVYGDTPLHQVVIFGEKNLLETTKLLIALGANILIRNDDGKTPLMEAILRSYHIDKKALIQLLSESELSGQTPERLGEKLFDAIANAQEGQVKVLVEFGVDVNIQNDLMTTPLFRSTYCSDGDLGICLRIAKYLIEKGADAYARDTQNRTFLHILASRPVVIAPPKSAGLSPAQFHEISSYLISKNVSDLFNMRGLSFGATPLHLAVRFVDEVENRTLILLQRNGVNLNSLDNDGDSILTWSVYGGRSVKFLSNLVALGVNWTELNKRNRSLIHNLAKRGHVEGLKYFLTLGLDSNVIDAIGDSPLHKVVSLGKKNTLKTIQLLIENGASVLIRNGHGKTPLEKAVGRKDFAANEKQNVIQLLRDSERHALDNPLYNSTAKLFIAIDLQDETLVKALVGEGGDVNGKDSLLETPLHRAAACRNKTFAVEVIKLLIEHGANTSAYANEGYTFIHKLIGDESTLTPALFHDMAVFLISKNLSYIFDIPGNFTKKTDIPLMPGYVYTSVLDTGLQTAVLELEIRPDTLSLLQLHGVDYNAVNGNGHTVLYCALMGNRSVGLMSELVALGADPKHPTYSNRSLLHTASELGELSHIKLFLDLGLDINAVDSEGRTPLHAALYRLTEISLPLAVVKCLLEHGANAKVNDHYGRSPLDLVMNQNHFSNKLEIIQLLSAKI